MRSLIRNALSRVLAAPVAAIIGWLGLSQAAGSDFKTALVTAVTLAVYGVVHKGLDALGINPADAAGDGS